MLQKHVPFDEKGSIILSFSTSFSVFRDTPLCPLPRNGWQYFGITQLFRSCLSDLSRLSIAHYLHLFRVRNTQQTAYEGIILIQRRFVKRKLKSLVLNYSSVFVIIWINRRGGGIGRHARFRAVCLSGMRVQISPAAPSARGGIGIRASLRSLAR